ncbi:MAG: hypothetical protein QM482_05125 [Sulfurospirillum sp.]
MSITRYIWFFIPVLLYSSNYAICVVHRFDAVLAKTKIEKILNKEPQNVQCLLQLANIYLKNGKMSKGFEILTESYSIDPNIVKNSEIAKILPFALHVTELKHKAKLTHKCFYWNRLADGYFDLGIMSEAIVTYRKSLKINPKQLKIRLKLSIAYKNIGQIYNSIDQIKEALKTDPKSFYANYYMGNILKNDFNDLENSKKYFKKAYKILIKTKDRFKQKEYNKFLNKLLMER